VSAELTKPAPSDPLQQVIAWMIEGQREPDIVATLKLTFPRLKPNEILEKAVDHFVEASKCPQNVILGWALEAYRELYRRTLDIGDYGAATRILKEMTTLAKSLPDD
jgi:hypothetical protein